MGRWHQAEISAGLKKGAVVTARRGEKAACLLLLQLLCPQRG